jgi:hypothetical protein
VEKSATIGGNLTVSGTGQVNGASGIAAWNIKETASAGTALSLTNRNSTQTWGIAVDAAAVDDKLLAFITGGGVALSLNATTLAATLAGNLTVSGTGTSSVAGSLAINGATTNSVLNLKSSAGTPTLATLSNRNATQTWSLSVDAVSVDDKLLCFIESGSTRMALVPTSGNLLLGTTTDGGQKLQVAGTGIFTSNGEALSLKYSTDGGSCLLAWKNTSDTTLWSIGGGIDTRQDELAFRRGSTTVLYLDNNLDTNVRNNLNVSGALKLGNAYVSGAPTATGYVTIKDSAGNTYKVLVGT